MKLRKYQKLLLSLLSAVLLCAGWTQWSLGPLVLIALVPLLIIEDYDFRNRSIFKSANIFLWSFITFLVWNTVTTFWIYYSTLFGAVAAIVFSSIFMASVFWFAAIVKRRLGARLGMLAFISFWLAFEYLFMNSQISWPWLILGNAFANNITMIQWYEFTGHLGGSLWVLLLNFLVLQLLSAFIYRSDIKIKRNYVIAVSALFLIPVSYSIIRYYTYKEQVNPIDVLVFQPNIDPYNEKFEISDIDQIAAMVELAGTKMDVNVDFIIGPETAIPNGMWEDEINEERTVKYLESFLKYYPNASIIIGAETRTYYKDGKGKTETAMKLGKTDNWYDLYNTALLIDTSMDIQIYHKSKLVPGVEMMPYPNLLGFLGDFAVELGGMSGGHGVQAERTPMVRKVDGIKAGTAICYESIYGEFFAGFVKNGANFMCIITNDGWWQNTPGHRQHKSFASLRAIETRRTIARSANTGISCFVNQRGDILQSTDWWEKDVIRASINANDKITFYTRYGDYVARMALVVSGILILITISQVLMSITRKKSE